MCALVVLRCQAHFKASRRSVRTTSANFLLAVNRRLKDIWLGLLRGIEKFRNLQGIVSHGMLLKCLFVLF